MNQSFQKLVKILQKLPGVGPRQGARFVLALLEKTPAELEEMGSAIAALKDSIRFCPQCFNLSDNGLCAICNDKRRDASKILVVEKVTDLASLERTGLYRGLYHVLGGAINPVDNVGPEQLRFHELRQRIATQPVATELIIATNPTTSGETTSLYIRELFKGQPNITLTRLARGLSSGSYLEYADEITLKHALEQRK